MVAFKMLDSRPKGCTLKQKKEERDYRELLDFMKENDISAGEAVEALKASEMYRAKQAEAEQGDQQ